MAGRGSFGRGRGASYLINLFPRGPKALSASESASASIDVYLQSHPAATLSFSWINICLILPSIFRLPEILAKVDLVMTPSTRGTLSALDV